jgi:hypothetical protein
LTCEACDKAYRTGYYARPEVRARKRARVRTPEQKRIKAEKALAYQRRPDIARATKIRTQFPPGKTLVPEAFSAPFAFVEAWLAKKFNGRCCYCGSEGSALSVGRVVPLVKSGTNAPRNLAMACSPYIGRKKTSSGRRLPEVALHQNGTRDGGGYRAVACPAAGGGGHKPGAEADLGAGQGYENPAAKTGHPDLLIRGRQPRLRHRDKPRQHVPVLRTVRSLQPRPQGMLHVQRDKGRVRLQKGQKAAFRSAISVPPLRETISKGERVSAASLATWARST